MSRSAFVAIAVLAAGILPRLAHAQPEPSEPAAPARAASDLKAQVASIRKELDQLKPAAAQAQTLSGSVQQLAGRVTALEQQIDRVGRQRASGPDMAGAIDRLSNQAAALERDVESLRTQVAGVERPGAGPAGGVEYQRGFVWTTADGAYSLKIGGYFQPRYEVSLAEEGDSVNRSTFRIRRGRLGLSGHVVREELTYRVQIETVSADPPALDYYLDYELAPALSIRAGQDKLYFTRVWWTSDASVDLLERPSAIEGLRYDRDIGVWAHGSFLDGRLSYHAGLSNGAGPNRRNDNIDAVTLVRVDAVLLGERFEPFTGNLKRDPELRVMAGAGAVHDLVQLPPAVAGTPVNNRDVDADGDTDNVRIISTSADVALRWQGLELIAEGIFRHEDWGTILSHSDNQPLAALIDADRQGRRKYLAGYVHASFPIVPDQLQIAARVGQSRVALLGIGGRPVDSAPPGDRLVEATAQLRWFDGPNLSLGGSYSLFNYNNRTGPEAQNDIEHLLIAQGQLSF
jgi:hypothetical protein